MKTSFIAAILLALPLFVQSAMSQNINSSNTLLCPTTDGTVIIDNATILLRDYVLTFDGETSNGVLRFSDPASNALAELDTRGVHGLYLTVNEGGVQMQVVADRRKIIVTNDAPSSAPASPEQSRVAAFVLPQLTDASTHR
jgi:hypothetical protein